MIKTIRIREDGVKVLIYLNKENNRIYVKVELKPMETQNIKKGFNNKPLGYNNFLLFVNLLNEFYGVFCQRREKIVIVYSAFFDPEEIIENGGLKLTKRRKDTYSISIKLFPNVFFSNEEISFYKRQIKKNQNIRKNNCKMRNKKDSLYVNKRYNFSIR